MEYNCKNCGNVFDDALGTCPACGAPVVVESKAADPQPQAQPDQASQQPYQQQPYQQQAYQQQPYQQQPYQQQAYQQQPYQQQPYQQQPYQQQGNTYNYSNPNATYQAGAPVYQPNMGTAPKSKLVAGLLGIFLGGLGVHNFYLGFTGKAIAQLLISLLSCGSLAIVSAVWGLIEGILILAGSMNTDANGMLLGE